MESKDVPIVEHCPTCSTGMSKVYHVKGKHTRKQPEIVEPLLLPQSDYWEELNALLYGLPDA